MLKFLLSQERRTELFTRSTLFLALLTLYATAAAQIALPPEVPPFEVNVSSTPANGHIFVTAVDMQAPNSDYPSTVMLFNEVGELIYYKPVTTATEAPFPRTPIANFQLHADGRMSFTDGLFGPIPGNIYMMDSTFQITDTLNCTPQYALDGHDFFISDDGHYHLLAMEQRIMDASTLTTESGQPGDANCVVTGHIIQEFDENNNLIGEWKSLDHFALEDIYSYYFTDPGMVDHAHVNSLFVDYEGHYIISSRSLNEITRINRSTGQIMWRLGGKNNEFTFPGDTVPFTAQHDAQYFPDGTLVLFDNATFTIPDNVSRMLIYDLDEVNMTATDVHNFQHPLNFPSAFMGSARTLPNDHFIISWGGGYDYTIGKTIQEFDGLWNEVMSLDFLDGFVSYRAIKTELPWALPRPELECDGLTQTLSAPEGYESYYWSTGDTTSSIDITSTGSYQVWVNAGDGFISSEVVEVTDLSEFCPSLISVQEAAENQLEVYPVPASDRLNIAWPQSTGGPAQLELFDAQGRLVFSKSVQTANISSIDVSHLRSGIYHIRITKLDGSGVATQRVGVTRSR